MAKIKHLYIHTIIFMLKFELQKLFFEYFTVHALEFFQNFEFSSVPLNFPPSPLKYFIQFLDNFNHSKRIIIDLSQRQISYFWAFNQIFRVESNDFEIKINRRITLHWRSNEKVKFWINQDSNTKNLLL